LTTASRGLAVSRRQCCDILGWTPHTFDKSMGDGMPVAERPSGRGTDYVVFMGDVIRWIVEQEVKAAGFEPVAKLDLNAERARLAREQADGQAMKNEVARGELMPAEDVVAGWQAAIGRSRALMLGMPISVAPQLVLLASQYGQDSDGLERAAREAMIRALDVALAELQDTTRDVVEDEEEAEVEGATPPAAEAAEEVRAEA
jgi:phage terminase Nu1 subunit (DNA packaging protein)